MVFTTLLAPRSVKYYLWLLVGLVVTACGQSSSENYIPKPKGYPRIDLPTQVYQSLPPGHPYTFEYNRIARILPDTFPRAEPHWIFISYPQYKASVQLTYKPVLHDLKRLQALIDDAYKLTAKHKVKAASMMEHKVKTASGLEANVIDLTGEVPSQVQFITTDSTTHFLRGALYFNTATANDSLQPVIQYIRQDIMHLLGTLKWRK